MSAIAQLASLQSPDSPRAQGGALFSHTTFFQAVIEGFIDGIIVAAPDGRVIQCNHRAAQLCPTLQQNTLIQALQSVIPVSIWQTCEALLESHELFPEQRLIPETEVLMNSSRIRIRSQWLTIRSSELDKTPYILVTLEDRSQTIQNLAMTDIHKHSLTRREGEIWQLRLLGKSYKEIASELYITEHTVRKHVKNILAKRRIGE